MIVNLKSIIPFISFDFAYTEKTIQAGDTLNVWLTSVFNEDDYSFKLTTSGATSVKIDNYQYSILYETPGSFSIEMEVSNTAKTKILTSNKLNVTVE